MTGGGRAQAGYTLVELLVVLAITGLMATMVLAAMGGAARFMTRADARTSRLDELVAAQRLLRDRVAGMRAITRLDSIVPSIDAQGDETSFTFIAPPPDRAAPDALWRYRLIVTAGGTLMLYHLNTLDRSVDANAPGAAGWRGTRLVDHVAAMRVGYFGRDPVAPGRRWQTRWFRRPQPPELVRIAIRFREGDARVWPDLVIRPRASVNLACTLDPLTGRCDATT
jgi:general secretion pathway protein J